MSETEDTIQCTNCKHHILSKNFTIHSVHCQRNFYLCTKCEQPINFNDKTKHDNVDHSVTYCRNCHVQLEKWIIKKHVKEECPSRKVKCQICDIEVKATEIKEHENYCGSRTEKCSECGEFVMLRYKTLHVESNHTFIKLSDEPGPSPSWQNGRRTLCNFMPDLTSKNTKPLPVRRRKKSRNSDSRSKNSESDDGFGTSPSKNDNYEVNMKVNDIKEERKSVRKDIDEWPALSSLMSLQISDDNKRKTKHTNFKAVNPIESDLMYALKVSEELNSQIWDKNLFSRRKPIDNSLRNMSENPETEVKNSGSNLLISKNIKDKNGELNIYKNDSDEDICSYKINKYEIQEPVKLPCEFCGTLIVSHELILHQSRCSLLMRESFGTRNSSYKFSYLNDDLDNKVPCADCNKFFRLSMLENHQLHCQKNLMKSCKNQDKASYIKSIKPVKVKSEPGLQNGIEPSSPRLSRMGTRSEWLSELSKDTQEKESDLRINNLNDPESGVRARPKLSKKSRRAPSPPKM